MKENSPLLLQPYHHKRCKTAASALNKHVLVFQSKKIGLSLAFEENILYLCTDE